MSTQEYEFIKDLLETDAEGYKDEIIKFMQQCVKDEVVEKKTEEEKLLEANPYDPEKRKSEYSLFNFFVRTMYASEYSVLFEVHKTEHETLHDYLIAKYRDHVEHFGIFDNEEYQFFKKIALQAQVRFLKKARKKCFEKNTLF